MNDYSVMIKYRRNGDISIGVGGDGKTVYIFRVQSYWEAMDCAREMQAWLERLRRKRGNNRPVEIKEM